VNLGPAEIGQRSETVRRSNLSTIVRVLHAGGALSRSDLVARTGLTRSAIRSLTGELVAADLAIEEPPTLLGTPGRPSPVVRLNPEGSISLGLEIAVDSLAATVVGLGGEILALTREPRHRGHSSIDEVIVALARLADHVLDERPADTRLAGIGVAVVGVVRERDGLVSMAPNLGWHDVPLGERLADALALPAAVGVANEADLGALAEHRRGVGVGTDDLVFISGEVGVGGGLIVGGRPLRGAAGYGGEVGHMVVNPAGDACRCGSVGCWETEVGEEKLLRRAGRPDSGGAGSVDALLKDAAGGDLRAIAALGETARWLGLGLGSLVNVLNPRLVVLGGRFGRIFPFIRETLRTELDRHALEAPARLVSVLPAGLGVDAPLIGAAERAFDSILADPAAVIASRLGSAEPANPYERASA
jgi:predicted NBD/HSP70 family sugar kinase